MASESTENGTGTSFGRGELSGPQDVGEGKKVCSNSPGDFCMQKFRLYETRSNFYLIGRDQARTYWRVLKIDRLDPSGLNILEDSTTYTERECSDLLRTINEGNKYTGGLKFVTTCYGIIGFIKFLGPYYMLLITKRRQIGAICGHNIYAVSKCEMIPVLNSTVCPSILNSRDESRYKKLLCTMDLTKDFFFSYSYHIMHSLQKNLCDIQNGQVLYETMFVWNEFLTRGIRNNLQNTLWTVALVYGFFKQATLSVSGREFILTLIARRSRHYAGTRYLKRGVNEEGRVANDVETEQIVYENVPGVYPLQISSVVQNRGSIPLFWSQETSRLNIRPDITLSKRDKDYAATRLHFENLAQRYGNPIIILNLIKKQEKKPRESILRAEFANAIAHMNKNLSEENRLMFLHWDLSKHARSKATDALLLLSRIAAHALTLTGFFYCQIAPASIFCESVGFPCPRDAGNGDLFPQNDNDDNDNHRDFERKPSSSRIIDKEIDAVNALKFQKGVLRTNCIDCLDRTNVAQYAYGLAAFGQQLHTLGAIDNAKIDLGAPLADELMGFYEKMGDTLAHQYGGSAAHNKIFSEKRGQWRAATQSQEFFRTLQRYYSNAYMDSEKQNAMNIFLGHFQPEKDKPALWELDYYQQRDTVRAFVKGTWSDMNILHQGSSPSTITNVKQDNFINSEFSEGAGGYNILEESSPNISTSESDIGYSSYAPAVPQRQFFGDMQVENYPESERICYNEHEDAVNSSNFVDLDWWSSSANSCEDELFDRSSILTPSPGMSSENVINGLTGETAPISSEYGLGMKGRIQTETDLHSNQQASNVLEEYTDGFVQWVNNGGMLCH